MAPPPKRRRIAGGSKDKRLEEIVFEPAARAEYLTGFHKRKQARIKHAQEVAAKKEREEHLRERREMRQQRQKDLEDHIRAVNEALNRNEHQSTIRDSSENDDEESKEWCGIVDDSTVVVVPINHADEYIDEDAYTTVTVQDVNITRDGFDSLDGDAADEDAADEEIQSRSNGNGARKNMTGDKAKPKEVATKAVRPKKKRKKFRYESKAERKLTRAKQRGANSKQAQARREKK